MLRKSEFSDSKQVGSDTEKRTITKTRQETDNARDRQYDIDNAPKRI